MFQFFFDSFVCSAKYRRVGFDKEVDERLRQICIEISERFKIIFVEIGR